MNKTFEREILIPEATWSLMEPMPTALAELSPKPLTLMGGIGCSDLKSERLGETWQFALESRMNGAIGRQDIGL